MSSCLATKSAGRTLAQLAIVMFLMCFLATARTGAESEKSLKNPTKNPVKVGLEKNLVKVNSPAAIASTPQKIVLSPSRFHGRASSGYASAKACPEVIDQLFCYCGCDLSEGHHTLLDCFTSEHGAYCDDCQEETILAHKLHKDGVSMKEIQEAIDKKFSHHYPFNKHSSGYQKYLNSRLYLKDLKASSPSKASAQTAGSKAPNTVPATAHVAVPSVAHTAANAKLKPGKSTEKK